MKNKSQKPRRVSRRTSAAERERLIAEYKSSGLSRREFAERHGINPLTFNGWFRRSLRGGEPPLSGTGFVKVQLSSGPIKPVDVEADCGGMTLRICGLEIKQAAKLLREVSSC